MYRRKRSKFENNKGVRRLSREIVIIEGRKEAKMEKIVAVKNGVLEKKEISALV